MCCEVGTVRGGMGAALRGADVAKLRDDEGRRSSDDDACAVREEVIVGAVKGMW